MVVSAAGTWVFANPLQSDETIGEISAISQPLVNIPLERSVGFLLPCYIGHYALYTKKRSGHIA